MKSSPDRRSRISGEMVFLLPTVDMVNFAPTPGLAIKDHSSRRVVIRASRPSLIDLRFKGDPWVVNHGTVAAVCLGDYPMAHISASPLDLPTLNRALQQVRFGQARRNYLRRVRKLDIN
jgi:hypothetical protein